MSLQINKATSKGIGSDRNGDTGLVATPTVACPIATRAAGNRRHSSASSGQKHNSQLCGSSGRSGRPWIPRRGSISPSASFGETKGERRPMCIYCSQADCHSMHADGREVDSVAPVQSEIGVLGPHRRAFRDSYPSLVPLPNQVFRDTVGFASSRAGQQREEQRCQFI